MWPAPGKALLWIPVLLIAQGVFTYGITLFLSTLQVFLRDTLQVVAVLTTVWMFATPIFYPAVLVEQRRGGQFAWILDVNPMHWLIDSYRDVLIFGEWPAAFDLGRFAVVALVALALGSTFFMRQKRQFPDLL